MQLLFALLLAGNLLLTSLVLRQVSRPAPPQPLPAPSAPEEKSPDPVDEGFENIMRFTVHTRRGGMNP